MAQPEPTGLAELILGEIKRGLESLFTAEAPIVHDSGLASRAKQSILTRPEAVDEAVEQAQTGEGELHVTRR